MARPYNPKHAETYLVWAFPRSLATTRGITIVFFSTDYLDVSVHRVGFLKRYYVFNIVGCPIRKPADWRLFASTRSLSQLVASFIASESQGIHRMLLIIFCSYYIVQDFKELILTIENSVGNGFAPFHKTIPTCQKNDQKLLD